MDYWSSEQIQTTINFYSDVWLSPVIYRDARNGLQKLWANSNDNNFLLGCRIESRNISRRSKCNTEALSKFKEITFYSDVWLSPVICRDARNGIPKLWANLMTITYYSDVWFSPVIYRNARNGIPNLWANSNDNNFLLGCPIESRIITKRSKLNVEALIKFKRQ